MNDEELKLCNEWAAEKLDIGILSDLGLQLPAFVIDGGLCEFAWNVEDARCREVVREHFKIETRYSQEFCFWSSSVADSDHLVFNREGKAPAEAEIACINAIRLSDE